jgi:hypothetical protein
MWYAPLLVHRLEVLVEAHPCSALSPLADALAERLAILGPRTLDQLQTTDALSPRLRDWLLEELQRAGRVQLDEAGRVALSSPPSSAGMAQERRTFHFREATPPLFMPLPADVGVAIPPSSDWRADLAPLSEALQQSATWKQRNAFPEQVLRIFPVSEGDWRTVPVVQWVQVCLLLLEHGETITAHALRSDQWTMDPQPLFQLPNTAEVLEGLLIEPPVDAWRAPLSAWGQQRSLPSSELEACKLERVDHRLIVRPPLKADRLRQMRSELSRGEVWLMTPASGKSKATAQVELA